MSHSYCTTAPPDWQAFRAKYNREFWRAYEGKDSGETLYIDTRWVVLYSSEDQKVPLERIQDCLRALNSVYSGQNTEDLAKVPNTQRNPWRPVIGTPNIQFLPLDPSTLTVEYKHISGPLSGSNPVADAASKGGRNDGVLNIYISSTGGGSILGQAEIKSNIVYALYSTIGGFTVPGELAEYNMGKTVAHEVGHALGLVHTFSDSKCDGFSPFLDVPEQINPNFDTQVFETSPGVWDQKDDNRYKDRENGSSLSCLSIQSDPNTAPNEMGINIMDYGVDPVSLMFTVNQADMMREYLQSSENTTLALKSATDVSGSSGTTTTTTTGATSSDTTTTDSGLSTTAIVLISVFGGLAALLLIYLAYRHGGWNNRATVKMSTSYFQPVNIANLQPAQRVSGLVL